MDKNLQIAKNIIKKKFGKRRYKIKNSLDEIKNKCIMIDIIDDFSPSIILNYNNKNDDHVHETFETFHFGNQFSFPRKYDVISINFFLYETGEDGFSIQFQR